MANIVILIKQPGFLRYIQSQVEQLCRNGHDVHIGVNDLPINDEDGLLEELCQRYANITVGWARPRLDRWAYLCNAIRGALDYCHYLFPEYRESSGLKQRAHDRYSGTLGRVLYRIADVLFLNRANWSAGLLIRVLRTINQAFPSDKDVINYLRQLNPDLLLATGLVWPRSPQTDYVTTGRRLGIPTGYIVNSWDNLTNKGDMKVMPDRVFVWNNYQAEEAMRLHHVPANKIAVTGAPLFDYWFFRKASRSREEICNFMGLKGSQTYILYACSSPAIAPGDSERVFFQRWLQALRASKESALQNINVVLRPHPFNHEAWKDYHCDDSHVTVFPRGGSWIVKEDDRSNYFDCLYYCAAVVGINTSTMLESAIVGAPTFTIQSGDFASMQTGTVHFHYLIKLGIVESHDEFKTHFSALSKTIEQRITESATPLPGVIDFVRPWGIHVLSTDIAVSAMEEMLKQGISRPPFDWTLLCRPLLYMGLLSHLIVATARRRLRKKKKDAKGRNRGSIAVNMLLSFLDLLGLRDRFEEDVLPRLVKRATERIRDGEDALKREIFDVRDYKRFQFVSSNLRDAMAGRDPIILGPWISEVGFEILYWIPFLRWVQENYKIDTGRFIVISRGDTRHWYQELAHHYVDVLDTYSPDEFRQLNEIRIKEVGHQKQSKRTVWEQKICSDAAKHLDVKSYQNLHPSVMFELFTCYWNGSRGFDFMDMFTRYAPMKVSSEYGTDICKELPERYVAVKFYYRESFPETPENRAFVADIIQQIASHIDVVLLGIGMQVDDHKDFCPKDRLNSRIHTIDMFMRPGNNLAVQTEVIAGASLFVGTYGGMAYVANYFGIQAICFEELPEYNLSYHTEQARRKLRSFGGCLHVLNTKDFEIFRLLTQNEIPTLREGKLSIVQ